MSDLKDDQHPTTLTDEQKAALRADDPTAYDDEPKPAEGEAAAGAAEGESDAGAQGQEGAPAPGSDEGGEGAAAGAEGDGKQPTMIPKSRFDEAVQKERTRAEQERQRAEQAEAELAALRSGPKIDYDGEISKLDASWNGDADAEEFDGTHADYLKARDSLVAKKIEQSTREAVAREALERQQQVQLAQWTQDFKAFVDADPTHAVYMEDDAEANALTKAVQDVFDKEPGLSNADLLAKAHQNRLAKFGLQPGANKEAPKGPHASRDAADARAATAASATPPAINGGVGNRGTQLPDVDFEKLKPGSFGKLSREQQAAALGGEEAL